ncbi:Nn.00g072230.m01.CDS01 [Neocucurbitaria sp. VM-36]
MAHESSTEASNAIPPAQTQQSSSQAPAPPQPPNSQAPPSPPSSDAQSQGAQHAWPICRSKSTFFRDGLFTLRSPSNDITADELCSICLRGYSNDPIYFQPAASPANANVDANMHIPDHPAVKIKRCGHLFHKRCLRQCTQRKCPNCRAKLYRVSFWMWVKDVSQFRVRRFTVD